MVILRNSLGDSRLSYMSQIHHIVSRIASDQVSDSHIRLVPLFIVGNVRYERATALWSCFAHTQLASIKFTCRMAQNEGMWSGDKNLAWVAVSIYCLRSVCLFSLDSKFSTKCVKSPSQQYVCDSLEDSHLSAYDRRCASERISSSSQMFQARNFP